MVAPPADIPVTSPLEGPAEATVATPASLVAHVPDVYGLLSKIVLPIITVFAPEIAPAPGAVFMVTVRVAMQPVLARKVMLAVPPAMPVISPDVAPMVAMPVLLLVHDTPPPEVHVKME